MNKPGTLYFFTSRYPFGTGETFIENEIEILCRHFNKVYILPNRIEDAKPRSIPGNAEIIRVSSGTSGLSVIETIRFNMGLNSFALKELINHPNASDTLRYRLAYFKQLYARYWNLKNFLKIQNIDNAIFYTYWFEDWATVLGLLKKNRIIPSFISRAHGYDIYEERRADGFIPFRNFQLKMVDQLYCASRASMQYLKKKRSKYQLKIDYAHLGVHDHGEGSNPDKPIYTVVSAGNLLPIKRTDQIPVVLSYLDLNIRWVHFGDGIEMDKLQQQIASLPGNIRAELNGRVSNKEILDFYKTTPVDLFIHLSETEGGVPVAIQEAVSFGIPAIATDAGGIAEIVNAQTGTLIEKDFDPQKAAGVIENMLKDKSRNPAFRKGVRQFWKANFDAEKNYTEFVKELKQN